MPMHAAGSERFGDSGGLGLVEQIVDERLGMHLLLNEQRRRLDHQV